MKIRCLIVDDEPIARQIVEQYCSLLPELHVVASCSNALDAKKYIENEDVQIVFLDINMPVLDGLSFIKTMARPPQIILTTAYKEYAHEAFDLAVCDYLLKPFSLQRFIVAVDRAKEKFISLSPAAASAGGSGHCFIRSEGKIFRINFDEVMYAEADGNNVKIVLLHGVIRPVITFNSLEQLLPNETFARLHRSFIVNKNHISHVEGNRVFVGPKEIPIGSNYREAFLKRLGIR